MKSRRITWVFMTMMVLIVVGLALADVPPPPANQQIGAFDGSITALSEADCRVCHTSGVPDRHHVLYGEPIPIWSRAPYPDADGDGVDDAIYSCLSCHDAAMTVVTDCLACHTSGSHHFEPSAQNGLCTHCHGDVVDNVSDGHYIPTYAPSLVTPRRSLGNGWPLNNRGNGAGACNYCHDNDLQVPSIILSNQDTHHEVFPVDNSKCIWCHDLTLPLDYQIRTCESCHGPDSLHNIQADSPDPDNIGTIVVGGEEAGYGHVGRDGGPGDSDCWGCHGFDMSFAASANATGPIVSGPIVPTLNGVNRTAFTAGTDTTVTINGSGFVNVSAAMVYRADISLTGPDGSRVFLTPDLREEDMIVVTIPGDTPPGNHDLRATKTDGDGERVASNPVVISIRPQVLITEASGESIVTITGSGFGGHGEDSAMQVTGRIAAGRSGDRSARGVKAEIVSWNDTTIVADFGVGARPKQVTVESVFGSVTAEVVRHPRGRGKGLQR